MDGYLTSFLNVMCAASSVINYNTTPNHVEDKLNQDIDFKSIAMQPHLMENFFNQNIDFSFISVACISCNCINMGITCTHFSTPSGNLF